MKEYTKMFEYEAGEEFTLPQALGITKEREDELHCIMQEIFDKDYGRISKTMEAVWNEVIHPNEFAFLVYSYGFTKGMQIQSELTGPTEMSREDFMEFLKMLIKKSRG